MSYQYRHKKYSPNGLVYMELMNQFLSLFLSMWILLTEQNSGNMWKINQSLYRLSPTITKGCIHWYRYISIWFSLFLFLSLSLSLSIYIYIHKATWSIVYAMYQFQTYIFPGHNENKMRLRFNLVFTWTFKHGQDTTKNPVLNQSRTHLNWDDVLSEIDLPKLTNRVCTTLSR